MPWDISTAPISGTYNSSAVNANRDGNVLERTEFIIANLLNNIVIKTIQSDAPSAIVGTYIRAFVTILDINGNVVPASEIIITSGTITLEKSHLGSAFSSLGITQPIIEKATGTLYSTIYFNVLEWDSGDLYKLTISGCYIQDGITFNLQTFIWTNQIDVPVTIEAEVDAIYAATTFSSIDSASNISIATSIGNKLDTVDGNSLISLSKQLLENISVVLLETQAVHDSIHFTQKVYPTLANGIEIVASLGSWILSSVFTEIVPVNTITSDFDIHYVSIHEVSSSDLFELVLYSGLSGSEVEIGRTRFVQTKSNETVAPVPFNTEEIVANSRISAKIASQSGGHSATISIFYHN